MNIEVKKTDIGNNTIEYEYNGIKVDSSTWECAPFAIYCGNITDEDYACIVRTLYDTLIHEFGKEDIEKYIERNDDFILNGEWDKIDDFRWVEEEELFLNWGGIYYEDIHCPHCESDDWFAENNGTAKCNKCNKTFNINNN